MAGASIQGEIAAPTVHVIGAGLAGLAASVSLIETGWLAEGRRLKVYEAAGHAGGRCRSYEDAKLGLRVDNGNHLTLSGNTALARYVARIGADGCLRGPSKAVFDFMNLNDGKHWSVCLNDGLIPWWIFRRERRVPATRARDYLAFAHLLRAPGTVPIREAVTCSGTLWDDFLRPILLAALNTSPEEAASDFAASILRETITRGGTACRWRIAFDGIGPALIDPALKRVRSAGGEIFFKHRLVTLERAPDGSVASLHFNNFHTKLGSRDTVILAVPPWVAKELMPDLMTPNHFHAIVNAHFLATAPPGTPEVLGLIGGTAQWVFALPQYLSVTVSCADALLDVDREALAVCLWKDVARAYGLPEALPSWQIVKERRATFAATAVQQRRRPGARSEAVNLFLAGDWTRTGLPATIEGAIRSGERAALLATEPGGWTWRP